MHRGKMDRSFVALMQKITVESSLVIHHMQPISVICLVVAGFTCLIVSAVQLSVEVTSTF